MKKNRILIISIVLAIAFVACPIESTRNITAGIGFILGAVSVAWLGVRRRKGAQKEYEDTVRRYTGTTMMKVVWIEESVGYYDPTRPDCITENKPRKPVLGGMCFFMFAAFLLWFGIMSFAGMLSIS